jgi:hypothetical protein
MLSCQVLFLTYTGAVFGGSAPTTLADRYKSLGGSPPIAGERNMARESNTNDPMVGDVGFMVD